MLIRLCWYNLRMRRNHLAKFAAAAILGIGLVPLISLAQTDLRETIRAEIMKDPRSASIPAAQVEQMIDALTEEAQSKGITSEDILWAPLPTNTAASQNNTAAEACTSFSCRIAGAFGGKDSIYTIPILLLSLVALVYIARFFHRRPHHESA